VKVKEGTRVRINRDLADDGKVYLAAGSAGTVVEVRRSERREYQEWTIHDRKPRFEAIVQFDSDGPRVGFNLDDSRLSPIDS
jgi:Na+-transporting NADH:ubiquinone oxidoreductase subunit NqrA